MNDQIKIKVLLTSILFFLVSCTHIQTKRSDLKGKNIPKNSQASQQSIANSQNQIGANTDLNSKKNSAVTTEETDSTSSEVVQEDIEVTGEEPQKETLKLGIVLGPGSLRAFAHIGFLQELSKAKVNPTAIVGIEMSSLVAAIYAKKGQPFDVEWQMMKAREEIFLKKNFLLNEKSQDVTELNDFENGVFGSATIENNIISFACPSFNLNKNQVTMMSRGPLTSVLPYCIAYPPLYKPYQQNIAGVIAISESVQYLKSKGANYIVYVDILGVDNYPFFKDIDSNKNLSWTLISKSIESNLSLFNKVIRIPLKNFELNDFDNRRNMIQKGKDIGRKFSQELLSEMESR